MTTKTVFTIYKPFLDLKLYYIAKHEWGFEVELARFFNSEQETQTALDRLKTVDKQILDMHSIKPEELVIESSIQEVTEFLHFSM